MPIHRRHDSEGPYYQDGDSGKKFHYKPKNKRSRASAYGRARKQQKARKANQRRRG